MVRRALAQAPGFLALVLLPFAATGCGNSPSTPSDYAPYSQIDLVFGEGASAETGKVLTVNYTGWFYDLTKTDQKGLMFDTSRGYGPLSYTVGGGQVIAGWEQGVPGMRVGGVRRLVVPPSLGYGGTRRSIVPPDATLVFEIELLGVQ